MKYDFDLDLETRNSLSLIIKRVKPNSTILEFGPANGRMTKYLKEQLNCKVYAVELDSDAAKDAKKYCENILIENIEEYTWLETYKDIEFDYIIFADILEHLYFPETVLKRSISLLNEDGSVLLSVPNIAHNAIIIELLQDEFTYHNIGLLDYTHIRFFTKNTLEQLLHKADLHVYYETGTYVHPINTEFQHDYAEIDNNCADTLKNRRYGEAYQFIIEATKKDLGQIIDFQIEDTATLYYDRGSGFHENESITSKFSFEHQNKIIFTYSDPIKEIKSIRIDPLEHALEIKISSLKVNGKEYSNLISHNGIEKAEGKITFLHDDPQIFLKIENNIILKSVTLEYESLKEINNIKDRLLLEKKQKILEQEQQLQTNNQQLQEKSQQLQEKEQKILEQEQQLQTNNQQLQEKSQQLQEKEQKILEQEQQLQTNDQQIQEKAQQLQEKEQKILEHKQQLQTNDQQLQEKGLELQKKETHIQNQGAQIQHLHNIAQSLRIKNRIKRILKKIIPNEIWKIVIYVKHNPSAIQHGLHTLRRGRLLSLLKNVKKVSSLPNNRLLNIYKYITPVLTKKIKKEIYDFSSKPLISIIMPVYNVDPKWLHRAILSVENQWYKNWELCIVDDKSGNTDTLNYMKSIDNPKIKIRYLEKNVNISGASNEALKLASGEYIALLDNDDELTSDALYEVVKAINKHDAEFIYSDEDSLTTEDQCTKPHFKPDYSPDLLLTHNYITHFSVIKKSIIDEIGFFRSQFDGAQDHDLFLRVVEKTKNIHHISKVLYHWRMLPTSTNSNPYAKPEALENGRQVMVDTLKRRNIKGTVTHMSNMPYFYHVKRELAEKPLVSIVIPFKDMPKLLTMCIESILNKSTYKNFEIIGISNNSQDKSTFDEMRRLTSLDKRIKFHEYNVPFNYSKINNYAVNTYAKGEHIILLNNDIEIITPTWIENMLVLSQRNDTGAVGAKLYYPNDTIQHAGVIIGIGGVAGHAHKCFPKEYSGYFNRAKVIQNFSAVTAACLMIQKSIYNELNGLNEKDLSVAFNDVDFCLRVQEKGYINVFTPFAEAYHHESISRGYEDTVEKIQRFNKEIEFMHYRYKSILEKGDPYYNSNLTLEREDFSLR